MKKEPIRISEINGIEDYDFRNIDTINQKYNDVITTYKSIVTFKNLNNLSFNFECNSPEESLVENIEIQ